jgi:hypothetical protein
MLTGMQLTNAVPLEVRGGKKFIFNYQLTPLRTYPMFGENVSVSWTGQAGIFCV